eukprot:gb/GFBE01029200.1/.p1 GENE.gb/GFBE01029200.1/~~gb/GFBE01029200.1/.p1  ORF type:complete len:249 (+),score=50.74 gb/GFBE01029200.1/:1-747(+)
MAYTAHLQLPQLLIPTSSGSSAGSNSSSPWMTARAEIRPTSVVHSRMSSYTTAVTATTSGLEAEETQLLEGNFAPPCMAQYLQVCAELERTKLQLQREREFTGKLKELLMTQQVEHSQEVKSLNEAKEQLRTEVLDLIQDLETTLSARPSRSRTEEVDGIEGIKRSFLSEPNLRPLSVPETAPEQKKVKREEEETSFQIPNWAQITRNIQSKCAHPDGSDDTSDIGSLLTRSGSSLSAVTSRSESTGW